MNDTYMLGKQLTISVSTAPGLFNPNTPGVLISRTKTPSILISSSGVPNAQVKLDPTKVYWLNFVVGMFWPDANGTWNGVRHVDVPHGHRCSQLTVNHAQARLLSVREERLRALYDTDLEAALSVDDSSAIEAVGVVTKPPSTSLDQDLTLRLNNPQNARKTAAGAA